MAQSTTTILSINIITHKGKQLLHGRWPVFVNTLREGLQQTGRVNPETTDNLFLFNFNHPFSALSSCIESLDRAKETVKWSSDEVGAVPIQIVLHLENPTERYADLYDVSANLWNFLQQESIYLTRALKLQWDRLLAGKKLPPATLEEENGGVFLLKFSAPAHVKVERLFPHRGLALSGKEKECFYCGRTNHVPSRCPSKFLTMETQGLSEVGFLPFPELSRIYRQVFTNSDDIIDKLAAGVDPSEIKKNQELQVYLSYFDLFRIYQPRFLHHIAFTFYMKWEDVGRMDKIRIDSNNLNMGLDCLRVRQYAQARKWLSSDNLRNDGKDFYASVGLAFLALEQGRDRDVGTLLERTSDLAESEKDRIYIGLLLARHYHVTQDLWKADQAANNVLSIHAECTEAKYAKIKIGITSGFADQAFTQVGALVKNFRELYMAALMDPALIPIQGLVEEVLLSHYQNLHGNAKEALAEVNKEWESLKTWLGENDKLVKGNVNAVKTLQHHAERGTYYDLLTVCNRSKAVVASCHRIRRERIEFLETKIIDLANIWKGYHTFWVNYPYPALFENFIKKLADINARLTSLQQVVRKKEKTLQFGTTMERLVEIHKELGTFKAQLSRMVWVREFVSGASNFSRKLVISEVALNALAFALLTVFSTFAADTLSQGMQHVINDSWFHKKVYMVCSFMAAPFISMSLVFWEKRGEVMVAIPDLIDNAPAPTFPTEAQDAAALAKPMETKVVDPNEEA